VPKKTPPPDGRPGHGQSLMEVMLKDLRPRHRISDAKRPFLEAIAAVLEERRGFWPLTDRQIHYALLNNPPLKHAKKGETYVDKKGVLHHNRYRNDRQSYKSLCELATRARLEGLIDFEAIHDPTRSVIEWQRWAGRGDFCRDQLKGFLGGYARDLLQSQPNQIEIIGEKNTIANIVEPVAAEYGVPLTIGRGYCSLPPRKAMAERFLESGKDKLILLALSDFDSEGEDIAECYSRSMRDDFGIEDIVPYKVLLTHDQVRAWRLPPQMKAKEGSSRTKGFVEAHGGDDVFELEAIPPDRMQEVLHAAIKEVLDMAEFEAQQELEEDDDAWLDDARDRVGVEVEQLLAEGEDDHV
jgi:hypothetical protein